MPVQGVGATYKPLSASDVFGAQNAMMQYKLGQMKVRDYEKKLGRQQNIENILRESYTPARAESMAFPQQTTMPTPSYTGGDNAFADAYGGGVAVPGQPARFDYPGAEAALMGAGEFEAGTKMGEYGQTRVKGGLDIQKSQMDIVKAYQEADARGREGIKNNMELLGSAASGIYSQFKRMVDAGTPIDQAAIQIQPLYERSIQFMNRQGMAIDKLSPRFDPVEIEAAMNVSMGVKDMLALEETKRKNIMAERGKGVTAASNEIAQAEFGKPFNELGREDKQTVLDLKSNRAARATGGRISPVNPANFTSKSVSAFDKTGDYNQLVPVKAKTKGEAQKRMTGALGEIRDLYDRLGEMGSIVDVSATTSENIFAAIGASDLGQFAGRVTGSETQSLRNRINAIRPMLINYIRQASEMGARGLDSEKELEFYLQAATDPKIDIDANRAAINVLNSAYGLGGKILTKAERVEKDTGLSDAKAEAAQLGVQYQPEGAPGGAGGPVGGAGGARVPQSGDIQDGYRFKGGNPALPESWERVR